MRMRIGLFRISMVCLVPWLADAADIVSRSLVGSQSGAGASYAPVISHNGRYMAFTSAAKNLSTNDPGGSLALLVYDAVSGQTRFVHRAAAYPSFSADGELLAFVSEEDGIGNILLYDQQSGMVTSATPGSLASPNGPPPTGSSRPMLTTDGRWVLFESSATNLVGEPDTNGFPDLFIRDLGAQSNILVSAGAVPVSSPGSYPLSYTRQRFDASMTPDGSRVAFLSRNNPVSPSNNTVRAEVLVRDIPQSFYFWASTNVETLLGSNAYVCSYPVLNSNGGIVVFKASLPGLTNGFVLRHDLTTAETTMIASNSPGDLPASISADGRYLAYDSIGQIFRYDSQTGSNELATVNGAGTGPANGTSSRPMLTPDGRVLLFLSTSSDLTAQGNPAMTSQIYLRTFDSGTTRLVSRDTNGLPALKGLAHAVPEMNEAGTRVVFDYYESDLTAGDLNQASDVFVYDVATDAMSLLSKALPKLPLLTSASGVGSELNSLSADATKVTFTAPDIPSLLADTNGQRDVFLADLKSGNIVQISAGDPSANWRAGQGVISGNGLFALYLREVPSVDQSLSGTLRFFYRDLTTGVSEEIDGESTFRTFLQTPATFYPAISEDGRVVVYSKRGLLFLKDMVARTNQLVAQSRSFSLIRPMINPTFSPDHRRVLFQHSYPNDITTNSFVNDQTYPRYNLFARDLVDGSVILISAYPSGAGMGTAEAKSMSLSGRYVAHQVWLRDDVPRQITNIYVFDFVARANMLICTNCVDPSLSGDGRLVAYTGLRPGTSVGEIYVRDRAAGTVARIGDNIANDSSSRPLLSADGRYVVFTSKASNYVADDDNGAQDVFLHDRYRGVTYRLSAGSGPSARHIISKDGRTVVFQSLAGDLSPGDYNEALDIFSVRLGAGDVDNDGMDDAWEITYFNGLSRDGSGDLDGDGHSDFEEFLAGTDPTNAGSVLEVIAIRSLNPNQVRILWSATVGKHYVIQSRLSLAAPSWTNETEPITANTTAMSMDLASASATAFYRVVLVQ